MSCLSSNFEEPVKYIARIVNKVNIKVKIKILAIHAIIDVIDKQVSAEKSHLDLNVRLLYMSCFDGKIIKTLNKYQE